MAQLIPLPLSVSCFSKIEIGFTFLVLAHLGSPGQTAFKLVCVCVTSGITDDADTCRSLVSLQRSTVGSEAAGISRRRDRRFLFDRSLRERCAALQTPNKLLE